MPHFLPNGGAECQDEVAVDTGVEVRDGAVDGEIDIGRDVDRLGEDHVGEVNEFHTTDEHPDEGGRSLGTVGLNSL